MSRKRTSSKDPVVQDTKVYIFGYVHKCKTLNVREEPSPFSKIVNVLNKFQRIQINIAYENERYYEIKTDLDEIGYCSKEYIAIEE